jgi:parallel beta-helix repeat protein
MAVVNNPQGGIVVAGSANPVEITNCACYYNGLAGILLLGVGQVEVTNTGTLKTYTYGGPMPAYPGHDVYQNIGDGIVAFQSGFVTVDNCTFESSQRSGMTFTECSGIIRNTTSDPNRYGLVLQGEPKPDWDHPSNTYWGYETDILTDGDLEVPGTPPIPDSP